jgi:dipeptidyl aminopeptidase/acylaminoacyl peptidase
MDRRGFVTGAAAAALVSGVARAWGMGSVTAPAKGPRPLEDFAALPFMDGPQLSPDGSMVAARIATQGRQLLAIMHLFGGAKPTLIGTGETDLNWWRWVNNEWLIVGIGAVDRLLDVDFYVRRTIGVSVTGARAVQIAKDEAAQVADDVLWVASDGTPRIRLALQKSIYSDDVAFWPEVIEVDVSTGKSRSIVKPQQGVASWYADGTGTIRVGIGTYNEGRNTQLLYRERDGTSFHMLDHANSRKNQRLMVPSLFLPEKAQALVVDDRDGYDAVYKLDLGTMSLGEKVAGADGYDIDSLATDAAQTKLLGIRYTDTVSRARWLDPELAKVQEAVDKALPGRAARLVSMDDKRERFLFHVGAGDRPGAYYFMSASDGRLQRVAIVNERIGMAAVNPVRTIRYKARDGLELSAILTLPAGREAKALPVVMMPHGGPFARDDESWDYWAQALAERGYAVVQPNFRGSSGFGTAFAKKGEGQWGLAMQDDVNDALAEVARLGIGDAKRAAIVGGSYGGYAALRAAQRDGALYRCAVSFAGVADLPALLKFDGRFLNSGRGTDWLKGQAPDLRGVSPINFPEQFSIPVLLVHGKADRRVPVKQSRQMAERLQKAGKNVRYVEQPEGDHHLSRYEDRLQFLQETEAFLKQHNPA